ncbi:hypothetical protein GGS20DRAFT_552649 [Poronia punctata]|nr:hypothetical protein GGS20DRAFT_552649 [Poronia punctata]
MHRVRASKWLNNALNLAERPSRLELPVFLCPSLRATPRFHLRSPVAYPSHGAPWRAPRQCLHMQADSSTTTDTAAPASELQVVTTRKLPKQCRGCGALSQTTEPRQPGFFDLNRKAVKKYLGTDEPTDHPRSQDDAIFQDLLSKLDPEELKQKGVDLEAFALSPPPDEARPEAPPKKPLCDRCHHLMHHHAGESIYHPSVESIRDTLIESPYKYNHVYHILDAADFPMSLVPKISQIIEMMPLRSRNRRSRAGRFFHGQKTEISFIITRADLLAPTKPQVDALFAYLREVLRDALGRVGKDVRLGNLRAVSAKRSWWTKELKEEIWAKGGGSWLLGKANVGKSQLFEAVFPKGRMDWDPSKHQITIDMEAKARGVLEEEMNGNDKKEEDEEELADPYSLLPPVPKETQYPDMPLVSDLPGTTASPIRVPFGNGRGELIDLPGLERSGLEAHVKESERLSLLMRSRIVPEQITLKPGQSLLLGGFIRITPREPAPIMLTYAFTPIEPHVCRTDKAIGIQTQTSDINVENISLPGTGEKIKLAGSFPLKWDVTKKRTGPLTRKSDVNLPVERLPYRVLSTDILIEGVGWVEIVAQVRAKDLFERRPSIEEGREKADDKPESEMTAMERFEAMAKKQEQQSKVRPPPKEEKPNDEPNWPIVDVYSPEGKFIGCRAPMNGWMLNKPKVTAATRRGRPRKSMKGAKKREKQLRREMGASIQKASF